METGSLDPANDLRLGVEDSLELGNAVDHRVHLGDVASLDDRDDVRSSQERIRADDAVEALI
jgi:hypothetical protein